MWQRNGWRRGGAPGSVMLAATLLLGMMSARAQPLPPAPPAPAVKYLAQGWSAADRNTFYTTAQGSRLIPYAWFKALRRPDNDDLFAADQLQRYGYLRRDGGGDLPIGFVVETGSGQVGMTCAACHTGQLEYQKDGTTHMLRIDGAPAHADFQQFLLDLQAATRATVEQPERFDRFARAVLGRQNAGKSAQLKKELGEWVRQFSEFMDASLPPSPWGPGRLDAFGMIFNRVAARDLGIPANFRRADAPVSYPFVRNASRQDHTQWNGGVPNGLFIRALARNTGEVFGVFADFKPRIKIPGTPLVSYKDSSADFAGLQTLEEKIAALKPPPWPRELFGLDAALAEKGAGLFATHCNACHEKRKAPDVLGAWATPVRAVGTDPKMAENEARMSDPGLFKGTFLPPPKFGETFANPARTSDILASSVLGSLLDEAFDPPVPPPSKLQRSGVWRAIRKDVAELVPEGRSEDLLNPRLGAFAAAKDLIRPRPADMFTKPAGADAGAAYESRVLEGIWATAPYLHNGSVANLWELLLPAKERRGTFKVGSRRFDPKNVGFDTESSPFANGTFVADPGNGNGN